jgi:hypothetical protein
MLEGGVVVVAGLFAEPRFRSAEPAFFISGYSSDFPLVLGNASGPSADGGGDGVTRATGSSSNAVVCLVFQQPKQSAH